MRKFSEIFNFEDVGGKIKKFAKWYCWIFIAIFWIDAIIQFVRGMSRGMVLGAVFALIGAAILTFLTWIGSWFIYAFGELVEDTHATRYNQQLSNMDKNLQLLADHFLREAEAAKGAAKNAAEAPKPEADMPAEKTAVESEEMPMQKVEKPLSAKLAYALEFQTDEGMVSYLKNVNDETVQNILKSPTHQIRDQIRELLSQLQ